MTKAQTHDIVLTDSVLIIFLKNNFSNCLTKRDNLHFSPHVPQKLDQSNNKNANTTTDFFLRNLGNRLNVREIFKFDRCIERDFIQSFSNKCKHFDNCFPISNFLSNKRSFFEIRNFFSAYKRLNYHVSNLLNAINFIKDCQYFFSVYLLKEGSLRDSSISAYKNTPHNHRGLMICKTSLNYVIIYLAGVIATLCIYFILLRALNFYK